VIYGFDKNMTLSIDEHGLSLEGVERHFLSTAEPVSFNAKAIIIEGTGGTVRVRGA
jgi:hypothetical protein